MTEDQTKPPGSTLSDIIELGKFYFLNGRFEDASKEFNKALEMNGKNPDVHYHRGLIFESQNHRDDAQDAYELALKYDPDHKLARKHLNHLIGIDEEDRPKNGKNKK